MSSLDPQAIICQKSSLTRLHQRVQAINSQAGVTKFQKQINGQLVELERQQVPLPGNVEATMERIIKDYIKDYHVLIKNLGPQQALADGLPPHRTCRYQLASRRTISEKTAYNHLRKLRQLGLITSYKFRGSRHYFEIWIDPTLLFQAERGYPQPVVETPNFDARQTAFISSQTENIAAYKVTVTQGYLETEKKAVGNVHGDAQSVQHGNKNHGNSERQKPAGPPKWQTDGPSSDYHGNQAPGGAAGAANVDNSPAPPPNPNSAGQRAKARLTRSQLDQRNAASRTPAQHQAILEGYLTSFWQYAQKTIYPGKVFAEFEDPLILTAIRKGVYKDFEPVLTEKEWDRYQSELYQQIDLAAGYFERHPDKYPPHPYALMREGAGYFDRENERGFVRTRSWLQENQRNYKASYVTQRISLAVRHLQLHRAEKAPRKIQQMSYLEAYRHLEHQLARYGTQAQDRFRELVSTIGNRKPKLTSGFTKNFSK